MAEVTFITQDGTKIVAKGTEGSLMNLAVQHNVGGIDGDCGGVCSCATCHVHIEPEFMDRVGPAGELENDMLEFDDHTTEYSRLSCQIPVSDALDGLVVKVAR